jgi:hypothetical protein
MEEEKQEQEQHEQQQPVYSNYAYNGLKGSCVFEGG